MKAFILLFISSTLVLGFTFAAGSNFSKPSTTLTSPTVDFSSDCITIMSPNDLQMVIIETENGMKQRFSKLAGKTKIICSWNEQKITKAWVSTVGESTQACAEEVGAEFVAPKPVFAEE